MWIFGLLGFCRCIFPPTLRFPSVFLQIFLLFSLSFFRVPITLMLIYLILYHWSMKGLFTYFFSFLNFHSLFILDHFYWSSFKFTDSFSHHLKSIGLWIFISVILCPFKSEFLCKNNFYLFIEFPYILYCYLHFSFIL